MNTLAEVAVDKHGNQVELNKWVDEVLIDDETGEEIVTGQVMYTKAKSIPFCATHTFDKNHECTKCPYIFTGFRGHMHVQKQDGIYNRQTGKKIV